jgi:hypothetical protein
MLAALTTVGGLVAGGYPLKALMYAALGFAAATTGLGYLFLRLLGRRTETADMDGAGVAQ